MRSRLGASEGADAETTCAHTCHQEHQGDKNRSKKADPPADAVVDYGDRDEHCWNGDHTRTNAYSRLRYAQMTFPWFVERMLTSAPAGADLRSWRY